MNDGAIAATCQRWQTRAFLLGVIAALLSLIGAIFGRAQFFQSYLFACSSGLGCLSARSSSS